jgi:hypothetical protein
MIRTLVLRPSIAGTILPARVSLGSIVVFGAMYGASLGWWHSSRLAMFVAVKIPLTLIATALITALFNWILAASLGLSLDFRRTFQLSLWPLAVASVVLASTAPIALFFARSLPPPDGSQRTLHNLLYLTHTLLVSAAGFAGTNFLHDVLVLEAHGDVRIARRVRFAWIVAYAFVAGEVAWVVRPFVGSVYLPVQFLRADALHGNVYEFICTDILTHFFHRLFG